MRLKKGVLRKKLLLECGFTLEKATKVAIADEKANKHVAEVVKARSLGPTTSTEVHRVKQVSSHSVCHEETNSKSESKCKHGGKKKHPSEKCNFKSATCHKVKKQGHIAPVCKMSKRYGVHAVKKQESSPSHVSEDGYGTYHGECQD